MQTVDYFQQCEHTDKALRGDAYEGLAGIFQPAHMGKLIIAGVELPPTALAAPMTLHLANVKPWHVFCMYTSGHTPDDPADFDSLEAMRRSILLDERCVRLGDHLVYLRQPQAFVRRVHKAIEALGYSSQSRLVSYFDHQLFTGFFENAEVPLRKAKRFAYQKEYRIVAKTPKGVASPLVVEIGDISTIAVLTTAERFNGEITLEVNSSKAAPEDPDRCRHRQPVEQCEEACAACGHLCDSHRKNGDLCDECECSG